MNGDGLPPDPMTVPPMPVELDSEEAQELIDAFLRRFASERFLRGWVLLADYTGAEESEIVWCVAPDQDWPRTLGIARAGALRLEADYLTPDEDDED